MAKKKVYDDDDGRTIADMSVLDTPGGALFFPRKKRPQTADSEAETPDRPGDTPGERISKEDRRVYIFAALRAALLIAAVFICGLGLAIWLLLKLWS
ncbi:MAG: hypothetical protein ACI3XJ_06285 [Oscillospiraceae bacterium]